MFKKLYLKSLNWSQHPHAMKYLAGLSFIEAIFFPVPPDVMLAPMTLSQPHKTWHYATITMIFSVLGGILGYMLGYYTYESLILPHLEFFSMETSYDIAWSWFQQWGGWIVLVAACTPIPYKVFTVTAGALQMNFMVFVIASLIGRSARFFMVCCLLKAGNKYLINWFEKWADRVGWGCLILLILCYVIFKLI